MTFEQTYSCAECSATVYEEHLSSGIARYEGDRLLCKHCLEKLDSSSDSTGGEFEPIQFEEEGGADESFIDMSESRIHTATSDSLAGAKAIWDESKYKRKLDPKGSGATRMRVFHSKLTEGALEYMNTQVNDWIDSNDDVVVKFVTTTIGVFEAKTSEPNIFLTVFY